MSILLKKIVGVFIIVVISLSGRTLCFAEEKSADEIAPIQKALWQFKHENYEEALELFMELREKDPDSSLVAYYTGLAYKKVENYSAAEPHLEAAVTMYPKVKGALLELIDVYYKKGRIKKAKKWIKVAEKEGINPAQTAFFKGLILLKDGVHPEDSIEAFKKAKMLDSSLTGTVNYHIGLAYMKAEKLSEAREVFSDISTQNPNTSLAAFADQYVGLINRRAEVMKPFRGHVSVALQFDDNVMVKPDDETEAPAIDDVGDWRQTYTLYGEYNVNPQGRFRLKSAYSLYLAKQFDIGFYDITSHNFVMQPGVFVEKLSITFPVSFNHTTINDKGYVNTVEVSNINNLRMLDNFMVQLGLSYKNKKFLWAPSSAGEDKDSNEYIGQLGWFYFFPNNKGFANLKYTANYDDTNEGNWRHLGQKFSMGYSLAITDEVKVGSNLDMLFQQFTETHMVYRKKRRDFVVNVNSFISYAFLDNAELMFSHTFSDDMSNLESYDYKRNIYSIGVRYKF